MDLDQLAGAFDNSRAVMARIGRDQMANKTPCQSWDVAALVNHMISAPRYASSALATGTAVEDTQDFVGGDYLAAYDESKRLALEAFGAPGALEKTVVLPVAELPAAVLLNIITQDQYVHGWDLARATGQPTPLDPVLAGEHLGFARQALPPELRGADGERPFGPERTAPEGSGPADQLAAFLGREV